MDDVSEDMPDSGTEVSEPSDEPLFPELRAFLAGRSPEPHHPDLSSTSTPPTLTPPPWLRRGGDDADLLEPAEPAEPPDDETRQALLDRLLHANTDAHAIKDHLNAFVVGQEAAKTALSVLFSIHLKWFVKRQRLHRAPNALLVGPTGVGKTHTLKCAADYLRLPFVIVDATSLVPSGANHGQQIEDVLSQLVLAADTMLRESKHDRFQDDDISLAERGVVFLDEFDKLSDKSGSEGNNLGAWNRTTQRRLLKLIEGSAMTVDTVQAGVTQRRSIDTSGILFIVGGAFQEINALSIRGARSDAITRAFRPGNEVIAQDFVNYGFIPELIARLPIIINFDELDARMLLKILRTDNITPLGVWRNHFELLGKTLVIQAPAEVAVAKKAVALQMGARGLQQTLFPLLANYAYEFEASDQQELVITADIVNGRADG